MNYWLDPNIYWASKKFEPKLEYQNYLVHTKVSLNYSPGGGLNKSSGI